MRGVYKTPAGYRRFNGRRRIWRLLEKKKAGHPAPSARFFPTGYIQGIWCRAKLPVVIQSQMTLRIPKEEWIVVENKHDPIVSRDLFEQAGRRSVPRKRSKSAQFSNAFSGLVYCGDCKRLMTTTGGSHKEDRKLVCSGYKQYGRTSCTNHYMNYELLCQIVSQELETLITLSEEEKKKFRAS